MNKRGISHVEVIFAFVLFITFVAGAIYFINPTRSDQSGEIASRYALDSIITNASSSLIRYSFVVKDNSPNIVKFELSSSYSGLNAIAKTEAGDLLRSKRAGNEVYVDLNSNNFTNIELSDAFDSNNSDIKGGQPSKYDVASITSEKVISEKKIYDLEESYYSDYSEMKNDLGIPTGNDFSFYLIYDENNKIEANSNSTGISRYAYERNVKVAKANGQIKFGVLRVLVW